MILSDDGLILLKVAENDIQNGTFAIPNSVTHIGDGAFYGCIGLTQITIPNSVTHIGNEAFKGCGGLTQITIPNSVTHIGNDAFLYCTGLTQITIPNSVTHIGDYAFSRCGGLTQITIPNSVTHIGYEAFSGCYGLTQITIPNSVTHIGDLTFSYCTELTQITIPNSVTHIDDLVFEGCGALRVIVIDAPNDEECQRIRALVPEEYRNLVIPYTLYQEVNKAKQQALMSKKPIGMDAYPSRFPESLVNIIQQYDERLHDVINRVPLPRQPEQLDEYKHALQAALSQFKQKQEGPIVIARLQTFIDMTQKAIEKAGKGNAGFFDSPENKPKLEERQALIAIATKLIAWLGGDEAITFTADEKSLLRKPGSGIALILQNNRINIEELPEAPSPHSSSSSIKNHTNK